MSHHIVEVTDLQFIYPDGTNALKNINFRITHGESVAIIGANGSGKTTLLLHLNGYLLPQKGKVRIGDLPLTKNTIQSIRKTVGMVFQDADDQLFMPTVKDDVAFGPLNMGFPPEEVEERVIKALNTVGAIHVKDKPPFHLSGGEKRAVAIAGVIAMSPDILVMDEPSANLDPLARRRLIKLLSGFEHTKIIATNDLDLALELCGRIIVINNGEVAADDSTLNIFNNKSLLEKVRLEQPLRMQGCPVCGKNSKG